MTSKPRTPPVPDVELLIGEISRLDQDVRSLGEKVDRYVVLLGLIVAAIVTVGLVSKGSNPFTPILAPYGLSFLLTYLIQIYTDTERRLSLREGLELRLNRLTNRDLLLQPYVLNHAYRNRLSVKLAAPFFVIGLVAATVISLVQAHQSLALPWQFVHAGAVLVALAPPARAFAELNGANAATELIMRNHLP
jgi:hypothetical protein